MKTSLTLTLLSGSAPCHCQQSQQANPYDYFEANRSLINNGVQAILTCNGLFTSQRSLQQVFEQELAYLKAPVGTASGGEYSIDTDSQTVSVGLGKRAPAVSASFREGIGCIVMSPDQSKADIPALPIQTLPDLVNPSALQAASDWTFNSVQSFWWMGRSLASNSERQSTTPLQRGVRDMGCDKTPTANDKAKVKPYEVCFGSFYHLAAKGIDGLPSLKNTHRPLLKALTGANSEPDGLLTRLMMWSFQLETRNRSSTRQKIPRQL